MYTKTIYAIIDSLAIIDILFTLRAIHGLRERYRKPLFLAMASAVIAIFANILIAFSPTPFFAEIAYCTYFAAIDWIIFFLCGFCMYYTDHREIMKKWALPAAFIMTLDTLSIFLNLFINHSFYIYANIRPSGVIFYQTGFYPMYYLHLAIDYIAIAIALFFIIYRIIKSYSLYRIKYLIILLVLLLVIFLNVAYMMFSLVLDASVVFYAVAGTLIYFCISIFVPRSLMNVSIGRAVDEMNEGLILFDITGSCIYANTFSKQHFDLSVESCDGSSEPIASVTRILNDGGNTFGEAAYVQTGPDGSNKHYRVKYNPLSDGKGRTIGSYFLIEDETEEVFYLNEINEAKNEADKANKAKSSFLASMSHEIRTPLNSVLGMNEMILRSTDDMQLLEYAQNIRFSGEALLSLINDILDFSKIEADRMKLVLSKYNPHELLRSCFHYFEQAAFAKDLYFHVSCDENLPSLLLGDENRVRQILSNMISNAVKYTPAGGVDIFLSSQQVSEEKLALSFTVKDTGIGIAAADLPYLFDAFRRVNEEETASIQGTGLGLAITKELVDLMDGSISVDSKPGCGSTFHVTIMQQIADSSPAGPFVLQKDSEIQEKYHEHFFAKDASILVVDDVPLNLNLVRALLKKTQIGIDTAGGGEEAIALCRSKTYDAILLDHRMPDPDGIATFKAIRADSLNKNTPVIMLTANALSGVKEEYMKMGFACYLSKPVKGEDLEKALLAVLPPEKTERC